MNIIRSVLILTMLTGIVKAQNFSGWAPTPPMGWNSWDCYGPTVTESEVKANADYMAGKLKNYGWKYIVVDIRWYVENDKSHGYNEKNAIFAIDEYGRFIPSTLRFPSSAKGKGFKPLADYVHSLGLKFGIHVMRGIPKIAVTNNMPVLGTGVRASDIYSTDNLCTWLKDMYTVDFRKEGAQEYYNSVFSLYASWGVDFVKVDDLSSPYHKEEIEMIRKAIDLSGREIVFSTSPGETPLRFADHIKQNANMWRIVGDFWDNWSQLKEHFEVCHRWAPFISDGHFPDGDMLPLGRIGIRAENGNDRMCRLTQDEQINLMTLMAVSRSPLMFGGDLPGSDDFTLSLITNKEVLDINQFSQNNKQVFRHNDIITWTADNPKTGDKYLAVFNVQDEDSIDETKAIWKSNIISAIKHTHSIDINVDIANSKKLYLVVTGGGDGSNWDHADWIEPKLSGKKGSLNLTDLKWNSASAGWGSTNINSSIAGNTLNIDGINYGNGIGTHALSIIEFSIPEGYNRFTAKAGLDGECIYHTEGASVKFLVFTDRPSPSVLEDSVQVTLKLSDFGLQGLYGIKDLWSNKEIKISGNDITFYVKRHGARLFKIFKDK